MKRGRLAERLSRLADQVDAADRGESPMTVAEWDKMHGKYLRASDDAVRYMETTKIRQWRR